MNENLSKSIVNVVCYSFDVRSLCCLENDEEKSGVV